MPTPSTSRVKIVPIPEHLHPLFWSYRVDDLDAAKDAKTVIVQLVNYGTLEDWHWLSETYGTAKVRRILESIPATEVNPRTRALAGILFSVFHWQHAYRGAH